MLTAKDCLELGIIDAIAPEPAGGGHNNSREAAAFLQANLVRQLAAVSKAAPAKLLNARYKKFRQMGEQSAYSQEAMDREVELLLKITAQPRRRGESRAARKKAAEPPPPEALPEPADPMDED